MAFASNFDAIYTISVHHKFKIYRAVVHFDSRSITFALHRTIVRWKYFKFWRTYVVNSYAQLLHRENVNRYTELTVPVSL